jgi:hypothetical protein
MAVSQDGSRKVFRSGAPTNITIYAIQLHAPFRAGATVEAWFSELSTGNVARLAVNQFIPLVDVCEQLRQADLALR